MTRLNDLHPHTRLDLIEETRWQHGQEWVETCIKHNFSIVSMCDWSKTRQGASYWLRVASGEFNPVLN
jgi:hypothetical protein